MAALGIASSTNVRRCSCPIIEQATADGRAYLAILGRVWEASDARSTARGLRKRTAIRAHTAAAEEYRTIQTYTQHRWGSTPQTPAEFEPSTTLCSRQ